MVDVFNTRSYNAYTGVFYNHMSGVIAEPFGSMHSEKFTKRDVHSVFQKECRFIAAAKTVTQLPTPTRMREVVFCGRSNVGKSSLLNALFFNRKVAFVSKTPGRTRGLNFFDVGHRLVLVDAPGYGYAKRSRSEVDLWANMMAYYVEKRNNLSKIFILMDSRRGVMNHDEQVMSWLDKRNISFQVVMTKADKVNDKELAEAYSEVSDMRRYFATLDERIIVTSSVKGVGLDKLRYEIAGVLYEL